MIERKHDMIYVPTVLDARMVIKSGCITLNDDGDDLLNFNLLYRVIKRIYDVVYRIQKSPKVKMKVVHLGRLMKYRGNNLESGTVRDEQL